MGSCANCIVPPHMVESIKLRGNERQRAMAQELERESAAVRFEREAALPPGGPHAVTVALGRAAKRSTHDAKNEQSPLPGELVRQDGAPPVADVVVNEAHDGALDTYELYRDAYDRDSLDGYGMTLVSSVHFGHEVNNAFWNGRQMLYGDGDGVLFSPLTRSLSVIGHELSHGVVQFSGGLIYQDQSGALNESFADVFGALAVQYKHRVSAAGASWLVGDGILGPDVEGTALRSLKAPGTAYADPLLGKDPQPYHMDQFVFTAADNGGVHINSGIPNHAFYLLSQYLGGHAWQKPGHIWYETLQRIDNPHATFADWADKTVEVAREQHGVGSQEALFTRRAWKLVGISV